MITRLTKVLALLSFALRIPRLSKKIPSAIAVFGLLGILMFTSQLNAQVRFTEVNEVSNTYKVRNFGASTVNITNWWMCGRFSYTQLNSLTVQSGSLNLAPGAEVIFSGFAINTTSSDVGLYNSPSFGSPTAMEDFMQYGASGIGRENVAVAKGIWTAGTFVPTPGQFYYVGNGQQNGVQFWSQQPPASCQAFYQFTLGNCPTVLFFDGSTASPGTVTHRIWDFGDGGASTQQNPQHTYTANGTYVTCLTITTSDSCISTYCDSIVVNCIQAPACQAGFIPQMPNCSTLTPVPNSTSSPGTINSHSWTFGDGGTSNQPMPTHVYAANGSYLVCLTITTTDSCVSTFCDTVSVNCPPASCSAVFQYTQAQCPTISFFDGSFASPGTVNGWIWDFGDGGASTQQNPQHTYTANGTYLACLTITTTDSCTSTFCDSVVISCIAAPSCQAAFQFSTSGCPQVFFQEFSTASPGTINSYNWNFGDGGTSTQQNPGHTYTANGTYVACLTITTTDSCVSTFCDSIVISCIQPSSCNAVFQFTQAQCPTILFFDASVANPGTVNGWSWTFGDGGSSSLQNPQHTYAANGTYLTCLTITTSDSCVSTFCDSVVITCIQPPACQAGFIPQMPNCSTLTPVPNSTSSPGTINSHSWTFGDGGTSNQPMPTHVYAANGSYLVCLTITTTDSCVSTFCDTVSVNCPPASCSAVFQYTQAQCPTIAFFDGSFASPGTVNGWIWDFGDGGASTQQNPQHTYTANGTYLACLTITTTDSCTSTFCDSVVITCITPPSCQAAFQFSTSGCPQVFFQEFSTASPGTINSYNWNFGDGGTSTQQNPGHTYTANGTYVACLTITTTDSCVSTFCDSIVISCITPSSCNAVFQFTQAQCPTILFFDASVANPGTVNGWSWTFGDGGSSSLQNPQHTYAANGTYLTCLTITTSDSCVSTFCDSVVITCIQPPACQAGFIPQMPNCSTLTPVPNSTSNPGTINSHSWTFGDGGTSNQPMPTHVYAANGSYLVCLTITTTDSCVSTFCDTVSVNCPPASCSAVFQYTQAQCPTIAFFDGSFASPGTVNGWIWDFGDGGASTQQNPQHTYTANGTYLACLTITTTDSCTSTFCDSVVISCIAAPSCQAAFQFSTSGCPQVFFQEFSTASPGTINSYNWNFGDGGTSTQQNPGHTYTANGTYVACLTITTTDSCVSTFCDSIVISCIQPSSCNAVFQFTQAQCPTILFFDASVANPGTVNGWSWTFGDGGSSSLQNPQHTYAANGTYLTCLTITTSDSCVSTFCDSVVITCIQPPACQAGFIPQMPNCSTLTPVPNSTSSPGTINSHSWTFGDGGTSNQPMPTHVYAANGSYLVCLTITTTDSCVSTFCDTITVNCPVPTCNAVFQYTQALCPTIAFFDGSVANPGTINSWIWDFGDGGASTQQNPQHTYTANGTYLACLTITTSDSCTSTFCDSVVISCINPPTCNAAFQFNAAGCPQIAFQEFSTASPGNIISWDWSFGDGGTSTQQNPVHTYFQNGVYLACLTITTTDSCISTYCDSVTINCWTTPTCQALFQADPSNDPTYAFFDASTASPGTIATWAWDFGDGNSSSSQNPTHTYANPGAYVACLTITTTDSCISTYCDSLLVGVNSIEDGLAEYDLHVSPNPFGDVVQVSYSLPSSMPVEITVHDIRGKSLGVIHSSTREAAGQHSHRWQPNNHAQGMYFLRVRLGDRSGTVKLLQQR